MRSPDPRAYGDLADAYLKLYPSTDLAESMLTPPRDALYGWTAERLVAKQTALGAAGLSSICFDHGYPAADAAGLHGFHASEIPYVFGTRRPHAAGLAQDPGRPRRRAGLSDAMGGYWTAFARDGVPSAAGQPAWRPYGEDRAYMAFADGPQPGVHLRAGHVRTERAGRLPPSRQGRDALELERRRRCAAAPPWSDSVR
jgi:para-nitrobenzyl esterase